MIELCLANSHCFIHSIERRTLAEGIDLDCIGKESRKIMDESDSDNDHQLQSEDEDENEDEVEDEDDQPLTEEERIAAAAEDAETSRVMLLKVISILERKVTYPARTIKKIDDLVEDFFLKLEEDVHEMLCSNAADGDADDYHGLDNNRDTEAEVEAIVRVFPNILAQRKAIGIRFFYPIQCLAFTVHDEDEYSFNGGINLKAVSFIPVLARLATEFGLFLEEDRGGLLSYDNRSYGNVLRILMRSDPHIITNDRKHHELVDDKYLLVMKQLRQVGLLKKDDIQMYGLLEKLCLQNVIAEKRFRFLVEWNPTTLLDTYVKFQPTSLHLATMSIERFRLVFEYGIRYYPNKKGICLLFRKDDHGNTPFQLACAEFGYEVEKVVEDTLLDCQRRRRRSEEDVDDSNTSGSYNIVDALVTASIDEDIHLDCVYFLIQREPDVLQKLLLSKQTVVAVATTVKLDSSSSSSNSNSGYDSKQRKRKR